MSETRKYKITAQRGQLLLQQAAAFTYPNRLGTDETNIAERRIAEDEVSELYRELRSRSPLYQKDQSTIRWGAADNWEERETTDDRGITRTTWHIKDPAFQTEIRLDEDAHMGVYDILFLLLHPGSGARASVGLAVDHLWPLAEQLRLTKKLKEALPKGTKRRLELDVEPKEETPGAAASEEKAPPTEAKKDN